MFIRFTGEPVPAAIAVSWVLFKPNKPRYSILSPTNNVYMFLASRIISPPSPGLSIAVP